MYIINTIVPGLLVVFENQNAKEASFVIPYIYDNSAHLHYVYHLEMNVCSSH